MVWPLKAGTLARSDWGRDEQGVPRAPGGRSGAATRRTIRRIQDRKEFTYVHRTIPPWLSFPCTLSLAPKARGTASEPLPALCEATGRETTLLHEPGRPAPLRLWDKFVSRSRRLYQRDAGSLQQSRPIRCRSSPSIMPTVEASASRRPAWAATTFQSLVSRPSFHLTRVPQQQENREPGAGLGCADGPLRETSAGVGCALIALRALEFLFEWKPQ
jgi:hypothetical protein